MLAQEIANIGQQVVDDVTEIRTDTVMTYPQSPCPSQTLNLLHLPEIFFLMMFAAARHLFLLFATPRDIIDFVLLL